MGSTVSPDGRFLAATSTDKSVALQIFDLSSYKLIWTVGTAAGVNLSSPTAPSARKARRTRPTASCSGCRSRRPDPVPGQRRRHARHADHRRDPDGRAATPPWWARSVFSPDGSTLYAAVNGQNTRRRPRPRHRRGQAELERRHRPARAGLRRQQALREQRGRPSGRSPATRRSTPTAPRCPADPVPRHRRPPARSASSTPANPAAAVAIDRRRPAPDRAVRQERQRAVRRQHQQRHRLGHRHRQGQGRPDDRDPAVAVVGRRATSPPASR